MRKSRSQPKFTYKRLFSRSSSSLADLASKPRRPPTHHDGPRVALPGASMVSEDNLMFGPVGRSPSIDSDDDFSILSHGEARDFIPHIKSANECHEDFNKVVRIRNSAGDMLRTRSSKPLPPRPGISHLWDQDLDQGVFTVRPEESYQSALINAAAGLALKTPPVRSSTLSVAVSPSEAPTPTPLTRGVSALDLPDLFSQDQHTPSSPHAAPVDKGRPSLPPLVDLTPISTHVFARLADLEKEEAGRGVKRLCAPCVIGTSSDDPVSGPVQTHKRGNDDVGIGSQEVTVESVGLAGESLAGANDELRRQILVLKARLFDSENELESMRERLGQAEAALIRSGKNRRLECATLRAQLAKAQRYHADRSHMSTISERTEPASPANSS